MLGGGTVRISLCPLVVLPGQQVSLGTCLLSIYLLLKYIYVPTLTLFAQSVIVSYGLHALALCSTPCFTALVLMLLAALVLVFSDYLYDYLMIIPVELSECTQISSYNTNQG